MSLLCLNFSPISEPIRILWMNFSFCTDFICWMMNLFTWSNCFDSSDSFFLISPEEKMFSR